MAVIIIEHSDEDRPNLTPEEKRTTLNKYTGLLVETEADIIVLQEIVSAKPEGEPAYFMRALLFNFQTFQNVLKLIIDNVEANTPESIDAANELHDGFDGLKDYVFAKWEEMLEMSDKAKPGPVTDQTLINLN